MGRAPSGSSRLRALAISVVLTGLLLPLPALTHGGDEHTHTPADAPGRGGRVPKESQFLLGITTEPATRRPIQARISTQGQVIAKSGHRVVVYSVVSGRLSTGETPLPRIGDSVHTGQLLTNVDVFLTGESLVYLTPQLKQAVAGARMGVQMAQQQAERMRSMPNIPDRQRELADDAIAMAQARLEETQRDARLGNIGSVFKVFPIHSPIDGIVAEANAAAGDIVDTSRLLYVILDTAVVWVEAYVPETELARLEGTSEARIAVAARPGEYFTASRVAQAPQVDTTTRTTRVVFEIDNREGKLRPGMFADVEIATGSPHEALAVPESAVLNLEGRRFAFIHSTPEEFVARELSVGMQDGPFIEVRAGLRPLDRVVTHGLDELRMLVAP